MMMLELFMMMLELFMMMLELKLFTSEAIEIIIQKKERLLPFQELRSD